MWVDQNADGTIDPNDDLNLNQMFCAPSTGTAQRRVPWRYSIVITIIRAGRLSKIWSSRTKAILGRSVIPGDGVDDFVSLTGYDPGVEQKPDKPNEGDLYYVHGKEVSNGSASICKRRESIWGPRIFSHCPRRSDFPRQFGGHDRGPHSQAGFQ
jgi:hypothetical protein